MAVAGPGEPVFVTATAGTYAEAVALGDLNADGLLEVAAGAADGHAWLWDHTGSLLWTLPIGKFVTDPSGSGFRFELPTEEPDRDYMNLGAGVAAVEISADTISPVTAALRLHDQDRLAFILESVEGGARYGRYSMVGVRGRIISIEDEQAIVRTHDYTEVDRFPATDPLEALRRMLPDAPATGSLPVSLASGVGFLSYESAARFEPKLPPTSAVVVTAA